VRQEEEGREQGKKAEILMQGHSLLKHIAGYRVKKEHAYRNTLKMARIPFFRLWYVSRLTWSFSFPSVVVPWEGRSVSTPCSRDGITESYAKVTLVDLGRKSRSLNPVCFKVNWWSSKRCDVLPFSKSSLLLCKGLT